MIACSDVGLKEEELQADGDGQLDGLKTDRDRKRDGIVGMGGIENIQGLEDIQGFTDIHCHVLPMVDDGAETMEMALDMLRIAAEEGIRKMILTPHQKADRKCVTPEGIIRRMVLLQEEADKKEFR